MVATASLADMPPGQQAGHGAAPIIIVGNGPSGMQCLVQLRRLGVRTPIVLFGKEAWAPYDRVKLSSFLAGTTSFDALINLPDEVNDDVSHYVGRAVTGIDTDTHSVTDSTGEVHVYSKLVLALGSSAYVPVTPGSDLSGVFRFRDMADAHALMARTLRSRHTVVIGGGLLGIEAARALCRFNTDVTLIQHSERLMNRQLDAEAADIVRDALECEGVRIRTLTSVRAINGNGRVESVTLADGEELECDSVVFATGIAPNRLLAEQAGLTVAQGIRVDANMHTSAADIYAIGECAQFGEHISGLVAPGLQQARVAAADIAGKGEPYAPTADTTWLKVLSLEVFSAGEFRDEQRFRIHRSVVYRNRRRGIYRRLMIRSGRVVGMVSIGKWSQRAQALTLLQEHRQFWPWYWLRFVSSGNVRAATQVDDVASWPANTVICQCKSLTRADLSEVRIDGMQVDELKRVTGAATVCGGCEPLLENFCGAALTTQRHVPGAKGLAALALITFIALALAWQKPLGFADSVDGQTLFELWSRDSLLRQISGFFLLGGSALALLLSLRKRISWLAFGSFGGWRQVHAGLGLLTVAGLLWHTGFSLGENLNRWLMISFLLVIAWGAVAAMLALAEAKLAGQWPVTVRRRTTWVHILVFWPVPVLLGFHILSAYFF